MNEKLFLYNLTQIVQLNYKHLLFSSTDFYTFASNPNIKKQFYPFFDPKHYKKYGFFNNGGTVVWIDYQLGQGQIKISNDSNGKSIDDIAWSEIFNFMEKDSPEHIYKTMKLMAFW